MKNKGPESNSQQGLPSHGIAAPGEITSAVPGKNAGAASGKDPNAASGENTSAVPGKNAGAAPGKDPNAAPGKTADTAPGKTGQVFPGKKTNRGSGKWIPFASFCTTGQFMNLGKGYIRHCGPTAAVNVIRTMETYAEACADKRSGGRLTSSADGGTDPQQAGVRAKKKTEALFLLCAGIGQKTRIYWNKEYFGRFGGTSNPLTGIFLRKCIRAAGLSSLHPKVRFHIWISPDAVEEALRSGAIVYLQIYRHPKYKDHHLLCYGYRRENGRRQFLLADGWAPRPVWVDDEGIGRGHYLTIQCV